MPEKLSTNEAPAEISAKDEINQLVAEKQRQAYLESLVGDGLNEKRNEEAIEYSTYLENMSKRDENYDPYDYDRINKIRDEKDSLINEAQEKENRSIIEHDPKLRRLQMMASDIADFKTEKGSNALSEKQEKFQEVFDKYESDYDINSPEYKILEKILYSAYPEKSITDNNDEKVEVKNADVKAVETIEVDEAVEVAETEVVEEKKEPETVDESGAESLPEKEKNLVKSAIERARDVYYKTGALYGSAAERVKDFFVPKQRELESYWEYESRLKRESFFKAVGLTALAAVVFVAGSEMINHVAATDLPATDGGNAGSPESYDYSSAASHVESGEGWYQTFKEMGIPKDEWSDLLAKVGPKLESSGYAYQMGDSYGISSPGQLPKKMLELIQSSR